MCQVLDYLVIIISVGYIQDAAAGCNRLPQGASGQRSAVDDNFKILIDGNPETYIPEHQYNVSLSCPSNLKFLSFTLVVESEDPSLAYGGKDMTGHFELYNDGDTRFNVGCENMIESTNTNAKTRIDVSWVAPKQPDSGCVLLKAGIVQHRDVWFIDDGYLTKRICPEEIDEINSQTPALQNCCACDEAKYEIVLERKWARNTHAKHFPMLRPRLGDIIGASHSYDYSYWAYGGQASEGMRMMAEHGSTHTLEREIRDNTQNGFVRTIIKAPGIPYIENVYGTTLANARVDPRHHQISLTSKVEPSPDWIVGVAGLELCLSNCTWLERKVLNLYPWDIGTDAGPSYMSPDQPQIPPDVIRRITSSQPNDDRSPFYDSSGAPMKPLATLYLTRKKLYVRDCEDVPQEGPLECSTHPWNEWSNCSIRCGTGYSQRHRSFKNPMLAESFNCDRHLVESRQCQGTQCGTEQDFSRSEMDTDNEESMAKCRLSEWSSWSPCSRTCGRGLTTRTRDFLNVQAKARCQAAMRLPLEETEPCTNSECGGTIPDNGELDGLPSPPYIGDTNTYDNSRGSWQSSIGQRNRLEPDRSSNSWSSSSYGNQESKLSPSDAGETSRGYYGGNQRQSPDLERSQNEQLAGNRGSKYNDYMQGNRVNDYRQDMGRPTSNSGYNEANNNNNDYLNNGQSMSGFSTRAPFGRQQESLLDTGNNYKVIQDYCYEKPFASTQPCLATPVIVRNYWFYDHEDHECKIFTTDNCDENNNRFRTLMACEGTCIQPQMNWVRSDDTDGSTVYAGTGNTRSINGGSYGGAIAGDFGDSMSQTREQYNSGRRGRPYGHY